MTDKEKFNLALDNAIKEKQNEYKKLLSGVVAENLVDSLVNNLMTQGAIVATKFIVKKN